MNFLSSSNFTLRREDLFYFLASFLAPTVPALLFVLLLLVGSLTGCGAPTPDTSSKNGQQMIFDQVDKFLTTSDCAHAVELIQPLYDSADTNNDVRMKAASAYGCNASVNYFGLTGQIISNANALAGSGFWSLVAQLFPSKVGSDYIVEGAFLGTDAVQATLKTGALVLPANQINSGTHNVGSVLTADRTDEANIYLLLLSMAGIGGLQSRYGNPDPNTHLKGNLLPWMTAATVTEDGCGYAASILNFSDSLAAIQTVVPSNLSNSLSRIQAAFSGAFDQACALGCSGLVPPSTAPLNPNGTWVSSGCNLSCTSCPLSLRNRTSCSAQTSDEASCAAAGIVNFINSSDLGWK